MKNEFNHERHEPPSAAALRSAATKKNLTADFADTRGWAIHLVRLYPRVSA